MIVRMDVHDRKTDELFRVDVDIPPGFFVDEMVDVEKIERDLGKGLRSALKNGSFIVVRQLDYQFKKNEEDPTHSRRT